MARRPWRAKIGDISNFSDFGLIFDTTGRANHNLEYRVWQSDSETIAHDKTTLIWSKPQATNTYDQGANGIGRRTGMTDTTGYAAWSDDVRGRVITAAKQINLRWTRQFPITILGGRYSPTNWSRP